MIKFRKDPKRNKLPSDIRRTLYKEARLGSKQALLALKKAATKDGKCRKALQRVEKEQGREKPNPKFTRVDYTKVGFLWPIKK